MTVGSTIFSFVTKVRVTIFPGTANSAPLPLFDAIEAVVTDGVDLSTVTPLPAVKEVTATPLFPARSV